MSLDPDKVRAWARTGIQPEIEARVLAAVMCEPDKLAAAPDLEIADFQVPSNRQLFKAIRNLQAHDEPIGAIEVVEHIALQADQLHGDSPNVVADVYRNYLDRASEVLSAPTYEAAFGAAAPFVFETDLRLLRLIAKQRGTF